MYYRIIDGHYASVVLTKDEARLIAASNESAEQEKALNFAKFLRKYCGIDKQPLLDELSVSLFETGELVYFWLPKDFYETYGETYATSLIDKLEGFALSTYTEWQQVYLLLPPSIQ